ncbi:MAG: hypothetical protein ACF8XB_21045 [Planctomycetota bacterium JB042]
MAGARWSVAAAAAASGVVGGIVGVFLAGAAPSPAAGAPSVDLGAVVRELAGLRQVLEGESVARPASNPARGGPARSSPERDVAPAGGTVEVESDARLSALESRLDALEATIVAVAAAPRGALRIEAPRDATRAVPFPAREEVSTLDFSKKHRFWTAQEVVDQYGLPDHMSINPHGERVWGFDHGGATLEFVLHDGVVARVEW